MGYVNNGTERSLKIEVNKKVGGNQVQGYPKTYDGQEAFPGYSALTDLQARQLSDADFTTRYDDFVSYVESIEGGLDFDTDIVGDGATRANAECLSVTTTTTSTTTVAPVYAFSIRYGNYSVDACNGSTSVVYSNKSKPGIGDFLYKNAGLTQPWDVVGGSSILFVSPKIYADQVVSVAVVNSGAYDPGEIISLTGFYCDDVVTPVVTTTTTEALAPALRVDMFQADGTYVSNITNGSTVNMLSSGYGSTGGTYIVAVHPVNTGTSNLIVTSVTETSDTGNIFTLDASNLPWTIPPSYQGGFTVEFVSTTATVSGTYTVTYKIVTNAGDFTFTLSISVF